MRMAGEKRERMLRLIFRLRLSGFHTDTVHRILDRQVSHGYIENAVYTMQLRTGLRCATLPKSGPKYSRPLLSGRRRRREHHAH